MASSSEPRIQTFPTQIQLFSLPKGSFMLDMPDYYWFDENFEFQTSLNNPCLLYPFELGIAPSERKLIAGDSSISETERFPRLQNPCCEIHCIEKRPCEFSDFFQRGVSGEEEIKFKATNIADKKNCTDKPLSVHITSGCFCQGVQRQPAFDDVVIGIEGGATLLNSRTDQTFSWRPCFNVHRFQEHTIESFFSQAAAKHLPLAPAVRLFHQDSRGVPSINEITAISSRLCGQISSLPSNASLLPFHTSEIRSFQTSLHGDHDINSQSADQNSARLTEVSPSPAHSVLNITPLSNYVSSSESTRASFSLESSTTDVGTGHRAPLSLESRAEEPLLNHSRLTETFLVISTQVAVTLVTVGFGGSSSLSTNAKILLYSSAACNVFGFTCCLLGIILCGRRRPGVAARVATGMGYIATVYGFAVVMGMLLSDNLKLRITGAACIVSFPALAFVFMK